MSIEHTLRIIQRVDQIANGLTPNYSNNPQATDELNKFRLTLENLRTYLHNLDQLQPNYNTNDIADLINAINLHVDLLKELLTAPDYRRIANGMKAIKTMLRFHPTKYSSFSYVCAWFVELFYFI